MGCHFSIYLVHLCKCSLLLCFRTFLSGSFSLSVQPIGHQSADYQVPPPLLILPNLPILQDKISWAENRPNSKCKIVYLTGYRIESFSDALLLPFEESTGSPKAESEQLKVRRQSWTRAVNSEWSSRCQLLSAASFTWFTWQHVAAASLRTDASKPGQQKSHECLSNSDSSLTSARVFTHVYFSKSKGCATHRVAHIETTVQVSHGL